MNSSIHSQQGVRGRQGTGSRAIRLPAPRPALVLRRSAVLGTACVQRCRTGRTAARRVLKRSATEDVAVVKAAAPKTDAPADGNGSSHSVPEAVASGPASDDAALPEGRLVYAEPSDSAKWWSRFKLVFALPWRRFKKDSVLTFKLEGEISDQSRGRFDSGTSVPQICRALEKAALDPRIKGVAIEIGPLAAGWAKLQEIRRYLSYFRQSGKFTVAYMKQASEKEYYLATACQDVFAPPSASISLRGFAVSGTFLRGVFDKVGVEPQVKRIGKYKSAGDQLLRSDMSEAQSEQLGAILNDIYEHFLDTVSEARGKTREEVAAMLEEGIFDMKRFQEGGWVSALMYEDEVIDELKRRTEEPPKEGASEEELEKMKNEPLRRVDLKKYSKVCPTTFGLPARKGGKKRIVVLRSAGAILGKSSGAGGSITPDSIIPTLRSLAKDKSVAAVVLRVDSPGGDALASDLMWREIRKLGEKKPVVASMGDVAASGGYYMAMGCKTIVAEPLTITGSIGVVTGKFNLSELYEKIGYSKTILSKGRYAELLADNRPFSPEEQQLFDRAAEHAYESFRNKAAESRGMSPETMQEVAQGRVWTGRAALEKGLVDALGGVNRAVAIARKMAKLEDTDKVTVQEMGQAQMSPLALLTGSSALAGSVGMLAVAASLLGGATGSPLTAAASTLAAGSGSAEAAVALAAAGALASQLPLLAQLQSGRVSYLMTECDAASVGSSGSTSGLPQGTFASQDAFLEEGAQQGGMLAAVQGAIEELL